ncbi:MAG: hypothetical protein WCR70_03560 [Sphaerochaetaceae bacterium]|jgi:hypothetical protein
MKRIGLAAILALSALLPLFAFKLMVVEDCELLSIKAADLVSFFPFKDEERIEAMPLSIDKHQLEILLESDERLLEYLFIQNSADALLVLKAFEMGGLIRCQAYYASKDTLDLECIHDSLTPKLQERDLKARLLFSLKSLFMEPSALMVFDVTIPGLKISLDGDELEIRDNMLFCPLGSGELVLEALGYERRSIGLEFTDSVIHVDNSLEKKLFERLLVSTPGIFAQMNLGDRILQSPFVLDSYSLPLHLIGSREGFLDSSMQLSQEETSIQMNFYPEAFSDIEVYKKQREGFYESFAASLALFGLRVLFTSLKSVNEDVFAPLAAFSDGLVIVSLGNLAYKLYSYWNSGFCSVV